MISHYCFVIINIYHHHPHPHPHRPVGDQPGLIKAVVAKAAALCPDGQGLLLLLFVCLFVRKDSTTLQAWCV